MKLLSSLNFKYRTVLTFKYLYKLHIQPRLNNLFKYCAFNIGVKTIFCMLVTSKHDFYSIFLSHEYRSCFHGWRQGQCYVQTTMTVIHLRIPDAFERYTGNAAIHGIAIWGGLTTACLKSQRYDWQIQVILDIASDIMEM